MNNGRPVDHELISALHDGELTAAERDIAQRLLEDSADARAERDEFRALSELLGTLPREAAPADLKASVLQQIATPSDTRAAVSFPAPRASHLKRGLLALVGGLTAAAGLLLAVNLFQNRNEDQFARSIADADPAGPAMTHPAPEDAGLAGASVPASDASAEFMAEASPALRESADGFAATELVKPGDTSPGDIFRVLEQMEDGTVVVVDATVVDVRQALDQVQLLLTNNSIHTVPVGLEATAGDPGRMSSASGNLAVYVESDPGQMNGALQALDSVLADKKGQILSLEVAGVLDAPPVDHASGAPEAENSYFTRSPAGEPAAAKAMRAGGTPSAGGQDRSDSRGGARDFVPSENRSFGARTMVAPAEPPTSARSTTVEDRDGSSAAAAGSLAAPSPTNATGYQQIVNFSKDELKRQLRQQTRDLEDRRRNLQRAHDHERFHSRESTGRTLTPTDPQVADERPTESGQRRLRLLLVLEPEPSAKADANAPSPVEAPRP